MKKNRMIVLVVLTVFSYSLFSQGNCLDFDGIEDEMVLVGYKGIGGSTSRTLEAWVNIPSGVSGFLPVITYGINGGGRRFDLVISDYGASGALTAHTSASYKCGTTDLRDDTWHHIAISILDDGSPTVSEIKLYVDGTEQTGGSVAGGTFAINTEVLSHDVTIGNYTESNIPFPGKIDEIRFWNVVRTQTQINENKDNELTGSEPGLVAYFKLNEGVGQTAGDSAGSNDGRLGTSTGADSADPTWIVSDAPLPVTLSAFTASFSGGSSLLSWTTQSESNNLGWNVYRSETENIVESVQANSNLVEGAGTTTEQTDYTFADTYETYTNSSYWYWIESVDNSGSTSLHGPARVDTPEDNDELPPELITNYGLAQNYPNPFNPSTKIAYKAAEGGVSDARLIIYNPKGQIVKIFTDLSTNEDELGSVTWDGNDMSGNAVSSGIYFYKLKMKDTELTKKMIMIK